MVLAKAFVSVGSRKLSRARILGVRNATYKLKQELVFRKCVYLTKQNSEMEDQFLVINQTKRQKR